jgi:hypothetical protein
VYAGDLTTRRMPGAEGLNDGTFAGLGIVRLPECIPYVVEVTERVVNAHLGECAVIVGLDIEVVWIAGPWVRRH